MSEKDWAVNEAANLVATGIECFTELDGTATARANLNIVADTLRRIDASAYHRGRVAGMREAGAKASFVKAPEEHEPTQNEIIAYINWHADKLEAEKP